MGPPAPAARRVVTILVLPVALAGVGAADMTDGELAALAGEVDPGRGMPGTDLSAGQFGTRVGHLRTAGSGGTP